MQLYAAEIAQVKSEYPGTEDEDALAVHILRLTYGHGSSSARGKMLATAGMPWPFHSKPEPNKTIRLKTDIGLMDWDGLPTASNTHRIWHAYSFYNPEMVPKLATILRFYHNYMLPRGKEKMTPAMKLGVAKGVVYERDLFSF